MFSRVSQASKVAFAHLIQHLVQKNFVLLDVQYQTDHLKMFGTKEIEWNDFEQLLLQAYNKEINFL
jgi:leucyl/phenylalanyl-tRNA--protein transferase